MVVKKLGILMAVGIVVSLSYYVWWTITQRRYDAEFSQVQDARNEMLDICRERLMFLNSVAKVHAFKQSPHFSVRAEQELKLTEIVQGLPDSNILAEWIESHEMVSEMGAEIAKALYGANREKYHKLEKIEHSMNQALDRYREQADSWNQKVKKTKPWMRSQLKLVAVQLPSTFEKL